MNTQELVDYCRKNSPTEAQRIHIKNISAKIWPEIIDEMWKARGEKSLGNRIEKFTDGFLVRHNISIRRDERVWLIWFLIPNIEKYLQCAQDIATWRSIDADSTTEGAV